MEYISYVLYFYLSYFLSSHKMYNSLFLIGRDFSAKVKNKLYLNKFYKNSMENFNFDLFY